MRSIRGGVAASIVLLLFALPFAGVGLGALGWIWWDVARSREARVKWVEVQARVLSEDMQRHRGSKGRITYSVTGTYAYEFGGRGYQSGHLDFGGGADNVGDYQQRVLRTLRRARESVATLPCRVNPEDPSEAVMFPDWRPELVVFKSVFAIAFGGVGIGMAVAGCLAAGEGRLRKRHPSEPWLWREEWHSPSLRPSMAGGLWAAGIGLFLSQAATAPLWSVLGPVWAGGGALPWVMSCELLLVLVGAYFCVHRLLHGLRYRSARLELVDTPVWVGDTLRADLRLPVAVPAGVSVQFKLRCRRVVVVGSGKRRNRSTVEVWSAASKAEGPFRPGEPVRCELAVPVDQSGTDESDADRRLFWELEARAAVPGVNLGVTFLLPVFAVPATAV